MDPARCGGSSVANTIGAGTCLQGKIYLQVSRGSLRCPLRCPFLCATLCAALCSLAWRSVAWRSVAQRGASWHSVAQRVAEFDSAAWRNAVWQPAVVYKSSYGGAPPSQSLIIRICPSMAVLYYF